MISIDILSDDILLEMFRFHVDEAWDEDKEEEDAMEAWLSLVHVCRRWRSIVFGSPRRLNLKLVCSAKTPLRDTVDIWPALPLVIQGSGYYGTGSMNNIIALLEHSDLVRRITTIDFYGVQIPRLEDYLEAMQVPFPELTNLLLHHIERTEPVLPLSDSFLGGSAPRLRSLSFRRIPYPGLPKLLLSATHLTELILFDIPHSGWISPEAMAACLSTLTSLEELFLEFQSPPPRADWESRRPLPPTRTVLSALYHVMFTGVCEYLEYLVTSIDAPRLRRLDITFFNDIVFDTPQLTRFIGYTPMLEAFNVANVAFWVAHASITLSPAYHAAYEDPDESLKLSVYCTELDWQLSFLEQVCTSSLPLLSTLEDLYMEGLQWRSWPEDWKDIIDYAQWLELLHSCTFAKNLYLSKELAPCVVPALQELVGISTTEAFPNLQNIFLEELQESGPVQEGIEKFVAARQVTGHAIAVSRWDRTRTRLEEID